MLASFYRHRARLLVGLLCLSFPYGLLTGESIGSNNDIETWLPGEAPVRSVYDNFKERFGAEELIVIGLPGDESQQALDESLVEAVCQRLEALPGIRTCWSPYRLAAIMEGLGVEPDEALRRLEVGEVVIERLQTRDSSGKDIKIPMMAITTSSSTSVKALLWVL